MAVSSYDLLVIGGGPAGDAAATAAHESGARVAVIERDKLGGTCHNYGCDPTKTLLHVAHTLYQARHVEQYGLRIPTIEVDWPAVQAWVRDVLTRMQGGTQAEGRASKEREGIHIIQGAARFVSPHELAVGDERVRADQIIIATGTVAAVPEVEGLNETGFITNIEAVALPKLPRRMAVVGSGAIGIEFAQMFHRFGVEVTVLEREKAVLSTEDRELAAALHDLLVAEGIRIETEVDLQRVERVDDGKRLVMRCGDRAEETLTVDEILVATSRRPMLDGLDLDVIGVETNKRGIVVDKYLRTSLAHIWAAGDVAGGYQFTHVADPQGERAAQNALAKQPQAFDIGVIPWVTYTSPELAHVGKTEEELKEAGTTYRVARASLEDNERAMTNGETIGQVKLLVGSDDKILGGHILSKDAGEMIAPVIVAMQAGLTLKQLADTTLPYPTLATAVTSAAAEQ